MEEDLGGAEDASEDGGQEEKGSDRKTGCGHGEEEHEDRVAAIAKSR